MIQPVKLLIGLMFCSVALKAQQLEFQASFSKGNIWRATPKLADLYGHPNIATFGINYKGFSERDWAASYPGIRSGAEITFIHFDNVKLGKSVGVSTFVALRIPYTRNLYSKFSGGVNWVSNPYDPVENPDNPALGGPWSFNMAGQLYYEIKVNSAWLLRPGIALYHLSSCSYFQPNTGINVPAIFVEAGNRLPQNRSIAKVSKAVVHRPGWDVFLQTGVSQKAERVLNRRRFWVASANAGIVRRLTTINKLGVEVSFVSSQADNNFVKSLVREGLLPSPIDYKRLGVAVQHELVFGRVSFYNAIGRYVYDPAKLKNDWYQRYGVRYTLFNNIIFSPTMVAHLGTADFFELSLGYRVGTN